jgi:hypothetical protein
VTSVLGTWKDFIGREDACPDSPSREAASTKEIGLERARGDTQSLGRSLWLDAIYVAEMDDGLVFRGHVLQHI